MELHENHRKLFDRLFREQQQKLFCHCLRFAPSRRDWAMDRVHDTFVKLGQHLPTLNEDPDDLAGWLFRVSTNECLQALRKQERWTRLTRLWHSAAASDEPTTPSPEGAIGARAELEELAQDVEALGAQERMVFGLVELEGNSQAEAAKLLHLSRGHVSKLHTRAMRTLKTRNWEVS
ncbi:MAG: hypothetical protein A2341_04785 [Deltaproteobacteria bacterium RIFOXYB12_FULL_58_9]|nr:MAG: hypothetical protein A2341_04785 [Deltaproteobacteria bacterium RIFOXYB12_FULL_58_9]